MEELGTGTISESHGDNASVRPTRPVSRWSVRMSLLLLVTVCLIPGIIGTALFFIHEYQERRELLEKDTALKARALVQIVDSQLLRARMVGEALAVDEGLVSGDLAAFRRRGRALLERGRDGLVAALADGSGRPLLSFQRDDAQPLPPFPTAETLRRVVTEGHPSVSEFMGGSGGQGPAVHVHVPVLARGGADHVVSVGIPTRQFQELIESQGFPRGWFVAVMDGAGTIVARSVSPEKFVGRRAVPAYLERISQSQEGLMDITTLDGVPIYLAYSRSPESGWSVGVGIPRHAMREDLAATISGLAFAIAATFGIALALAWFHGTRIAQSVRALADPALAERCGDPAQSCCFHIREAAEAAELLRERTRTLKSAHHALLASDSRFRATFEQAAVGIAHVAPDGRFLQVNDRLCAILGYPREELLQFALDDVTHSPDLPGEQSLAREILAGERDSYVIEKRFVRPGGTTTWTNATVSLVRTASGEPDYFLAVIEDIQGRKETEAALASNQRLLAERSQLLQTMNRELQAANQQLEGFLYASSHDLKGPLGRISNFSALLEKDYRDRLEGNGILFLDFIRSNALRLNALIDDLLSHARVSQEASRLQPMDLVEAVSTILIEQSDDIREKGAEIRLELPAVKVLANPYALHQVLYNLLENALKYSSGNPAPTVEIGGEPMEGRFRFWIRDNGIGFDMAYHDRIFEIFRRLHTYAEYEGSGIGLALVKRAMEQMDGRVWAESEPGRGATFYLEFELAPQPEGGPA